MSSNEPVELAIAHLVADAKQRGAVIRTGDCARKIALEHPDCGLSARDIAQAVALAAVAAGVPIQFTKPD